ncbi:uncharacterized protein MYCFIDRAFT_179672 [Pseudocercospora fijiensis CIRAD86]|uniref:Uncharacterized protein n=1 Tax=Pseudocercospora fijiensis (strain CIRAD86) TaxID=383855 RepID=M2YI73_PSEFD|nr:uncharacterized protein MYCFIDRAFT_179672 [Pseudocercospora fijiensis CIRAD86]EME77470.1 hypothetical protein MYCFIDRAFT_179672 [Pseudocercospora fijiensis CIRAD86]
MLATTSDVLTDEQQPPILLAFESLTCCGILITPIPPLGANPSDSEQGDELEC